MKSSNGDHTTTGTSQYSAEELLEHYRLDLQAANRSPKYVTWTLPNLHRFFSYLESIGEVKLVSDIGRREVNRYVLLLQNSRRWPNRTDNGKDLGKLSPSAVQGHVRSIKAFWGWLTAEGYLEDNPIAQVTLPKIPQYLIRTLTEDHIKKLLAELDRSTPLGTKYFCILLLLLDNGMRVSELALIKMDDVDIADRLVRILGKGQKERRVPVSRRTRKEIVRYIEHLRPYICSKGSPYLFPTPDDDHISVNSIQQFMKRLGVKTGLHGIRCSPHIFRHTFATLALKNGADPFVIKEILGHSSLQTTMKYVHLQDRDLKTQHDKFSPVENLFKDKS